MNYTDFETGDCGLGSPRDYGTPVRHQIYRLPEHVTKPSKASHFSKRPTESCESSTNLSFLKRRSYKAAEFDELQSQYSHERYYDRKSIDKSKLTIARIDEILQKNIRDIDKILASTFFEKTR